jgi:hypothetical protein
MHDGKVILCRIFNDSEDTLNYNLNPRNFRLYLKQKSLRHPLYLNMNYRLPSEFSIPSKGTAIIFSEKIEKLFNNKDCFWDWEAASQPPLFNSSNDFKKDTVSMWFSINFDEKQFKSDKILVKIR